MSAHDALLTGEEKERQFRIDSTGASLSWRGWRAFIGFILFILVGGGGAISFRLVTADQLDSSIKASESRQDAKLMPVKIEVTDIKLKIGQITSKIDDVRHFQYKQESRNEARRLTFDIKNRDARESEYDRIRELNEKRLKNGKDPCTTLDCIN